MRQVLWLYDPHWQYARVWQRQRAVLYHPSCNGALSTAYTLDFGLHHASKLWSRASNSLISVSTTLESNR